MNRMCGIAPPWRRDGGREIALVLVRHGQTAWNRERRFLGSTDLELDEVGHAQASALGTSVGPGAFDAVYSSPLVRARQTAAYLGPSVRLEPRLRELDQGELEGLVRDEAVARFPSFFARWTHDPTDCPPPGGESLLACQARAGAALRDIAARHRPGEAVAVVTHQLVIAITTCGLLGEPLRSWARHGVPNAATRVVLARDGELVSVEIASGAGIEPGERAG